MSAAGPLPRREGPPEGKRPHEVGKRGGHTWRARLQLWFEARLPLTDTLTLSQRSVYILPTRAGWGLGFTLLVLLAASINYQLNLGYLLTFLLGGCALVATLLSHETLRGLHLHVLPPPAQFAHEPVTLDVALSSERRSTRYGIGMSVRGSAQWSWVDVPGQSVQHLHLGWPAPARGWQRVPSLLIETRFPIGSFRVWSVWRPAIQVLVYPAPEKNAPPLPAGVASGSAPVLRGADHGGDFDGVRAYQRGDSPKHIVWKKFAKSGQLVSREREHLQSTDLWLDHTQTGAGPDLERRLERLCAWVLRAEQRGLRYGLRVPGRELALGSGPTHKRQCLEALATC